jgi:hypothetical protein
MISLSRLSHLVPGVLDSACSGVLYGSSLRLVTANDQGQTGTNDSDKMAPPTSSEGRHVAALSPQPGQTRTTQPGRNAAGTGRVGTD